MSIHETDLAQPLLAFTFCYYIVVVLWTEIRRKDPARLAFANMLRKEDKRLIQLARFYRKLTMCFFTIVICFALYPLVYNSFIPIKELDLPAINISGIIVLFSSLLIVVSAQVDFDASFYRNAIVNQYPDGSEVIKYSKRVTAGYLLMFAGVTMVLCNLITILLLAIAFAGYSRRNTMESKTYS